MRSTSFTIRSGLVADQPREHPVVLGGGLLEQLRRPADAGERVLDLVRQHCTQRRDGAGRAAMGQLTIHLVGDGPFLEHDDHVVAVVPERRCEHIDDPLGAQARAADVDPMLADAGAALADVLHQGHDRGAEGKEIAELLALHHAQAHLEERSAAALACDDLLPRPDGQHRERERVHDEIVGRMAVMRASALAPRP